jgi:prepilin signal peptidase PulO-like enzyme (type II secretory pathway)
MTGAHAAIASAVISGTCVVISRCAAERYGCRVERRLRSHILIGSVVVLDAVGCSFSRVTAGEVAALSVAGICAVTDLECGYIFDYVVAFGCALTMAGCLVGGGALNAALGGISGATLPALLSVSSRGRGLALGDVKLAALLGMSESVSGALSMVAVAFILGGVVAAALVIAGRKRFSDALPFAPFLSIGAWFGAFVVGR